MIRMMIASILYSFVLNGVEPKLVRLTPPKISPETIDEKIVCTRPLREGNFNISTEIYKGKTITHCYGHGGAGWTTLFGSVNKAIEQFQNTNLSRNKPIRIIGSGCMGLTLAVELKRLGYHVTGIFTKELYDIPSWKAAGNFGLVSVSNSPDETASLKRILLESFLTYQQIEQGKHPYFSTHAVEYMPVYCSMQTESGVEDLEEMGIVPPREFVSLDFGNGVVHHDYVQFMTYFMNTTLLMQELMNEVARLEIPVEIREVHAFDEISEDVIFNCSGLGSRELNSDQDLSPVRGHIITLNHSAGHEHMGYMICADVLQHGKREDVYIIPKCISVTPQNPRGVSCAGALGGTFIGGVAALTAEELAELDELEFKNLLERNSEFFQGHPFHE
jgi:D-amino-acid oxidase